VAVAAVVLVELVAVVVVVQVVVVANSATVEALEMERPDGELAALGAQMEPDEALESLAD
jgi:hypothetical protein